MTVYTLMQRFARKVQLTDNCWLWIGGKKGAGYGEIGVGGRATYRIVSAHRLSYELFIGPIPTGMVVMHTCDVMNCVNPEHLRAGTRKENTADMHRKGRSRWHRAKA